MPVSRRRIKKRPHLHSQNRPQSNMLIHAQAAERNYTIFIRLFKEAVRRHELLPEMQEAYLHAHTIAATFADFADWISHSPETEWMKLK